MNRPVHFEIISKDPERTSEFYKKAFGWDSQSWQDSGYWLVMTGEESGGAPGIDGGIMSEKDAVEVFGQEVPAYICTLEVEDIDSAIASVTSSGGSLINEKNQIQGVGWHVYCRDPDGNIFGLMERLELPAE